MLWAKRPLSEVGAWGLCLVLQASYGCAPAGNPPRNGLEEGFAQRFKPPPPRRPVEQDPVIMYYIAGVGRVEGRGGPERTARNHFGVWLRVGFVA